jgi:F0F1-type ATP synthase membrane subunit c/vacuolar-type H+-ATPase subunit K
LQFLLQQLVEQLGKELAAGSALDGIARNPAASGKIFTPFIIAMALIESLSNFRFRCCVNGSRI